MVLEINTSSSLTQFSPAASVNLYMSGRGKGRRDSIEEDGESGGSNCVLASMAHLLERLVDQSSQGNGQQGECLVMRTLRNVLDVNVPRSFQVPMIYL
ncbi:protein terminal ear1 [Dorcoceras hygrometricum]|uniref:Protein terminal ear1 n=1 Tax=Dorcoceras hygrometricum TaxID=472368 RepID=A0A2Z7DAH9_9LAMI|nr:protein terminal ear1 [Dorcoceras hygrometricum]